MTYFFFNDTRLMMLRARRRGFSRLLIAGVGVAAVIASGAVLISLGGVL